MEMQGQGKPQKTALIYASDLLARQEQSSARLREKLRRKGYEEEEADKAIACLAERGYLDDAAACARQFRFLYEDSRQSVRQICAKLMQRGFPSGIVRECVPQDMDERETGAAKRSLEIKFRPSADRRKMQAYLYRRGFDSDIVRAAVDAFADGAGEEW